MKNWQDNTEADMKGCAGDAASGGPLSQSLRELEPAWGVLQQERMAVRDLQSRIESELDAMPQTQESSVLRDGLTDFMEILELEDERLSQIERDVADLGQILSRLKNDVQSHQTWLTEARQRIVEQQEGSNESPDDSGVLERSESPTDLPGLSDNDDSCGPKSELPAGAVDTQFSQDDDEVDFWESTEAAQTLANFEQLGDLAPPAAQDRNDHLADDASDSETSDLEQSAKQKKSDTDLMGTGEMSSQVDEVDQSVTDLASLFGSESGNAEERWTAEDEGSQSGLTELPASIVEDNALSATTPEQEPTDADAPSQVDARIRELLQKNTDDRSHHAEGEPGGEPSIADLFRSDPTQQPQAEEGVVGNVSTGDDEVAAQDDLGRIGTDLNALLESPSADSKPHSAFDQADAVFSPPTAGGPGGQSAELDDATNPDTITAYMDRLLKQYGGSSQSTETAETPGGEPLEEETGGETAMPAESEQFAVESAVPDTEEPRPPVELKPRHDKESIRAGISSMRELANLQAREALKTHKWSLSRKPMVIRGFLAMATALLAAAFLTSEFWSPVPVVQLAWPIVLLAGIGASEFLRSAVEFRNQLKAENKGKNSLIVRLVDSGMPLPLRFAVGSAAAAAGIGLQFSPQIFQMDLMRYGWSLLALAGVFFLDAGRSIYESRLDRERMPPQDHNVSDKPPADVEFASVADAPQLPAHSAEQFAPAHSDGVEIASGEVEPTAHVVAGEMRKAEFSAPAAEQAPPPVEEAVARAVAPQPPVAERQQEQLIEPDLMSVFENAGQFTGDRRPSAER